MAKGQGGQRKNKIEDGMARGEHQGHMVALDARAVDAAQVSNQTVKVVPERQDQKSRHEPEEKERHSQSQGLARSSYRGDQPGDAGADIGACHWKIARASVTSSLLSMRCRSREAASTSH